MRLSATAELYSSNLALREGTPELSNQRVHQHSIPDSKVHGATMGPNWGRQDPGGPHVGPMNLAIWDPFLCVEE